jgi:PAS domain S-box-containing protein
MKHHPDDYYVTILNSIDCGVFTTDLNYKITTFNKAASKITGFTEEEAVESYCYEILRTNICETDCVLKKTFSQKKPVENLQVNILNKQGRVIPVIISTNLLNGAHGEIIGGIETFHDIEVIEELRKEIKKSYKYEDIISKNVKILRIFDILPDIADSDTNVLIQGPSGSGKELFARAIHNTGKRRRAPFITVNCGALPDTLLESELFGYESGAFTDASTSKPGRFFLANGGTIFLDEIGDTSPAMQVKLLRVIQEKTFEPLGGVRTVHVDVRIIAATNKDLYKLVNSGAFREDLYYRLNVIKIELPALKERKEDIPFLIEAFVKKYNGILGKKVEGITEDAFSVLMNYDYPGNIRELENIIEHAFVMVKGKYIDVSHFSEELRRTYKPGMNGKFGLVEVEKEAILNALKMFGGNRKKASEYLNIDRTTLWRKLKKYGLQYKFML